ncbi:MAG: PD-(D/E)XK nuclease family protein [Calditrichaeota bacterium]|nr:PD-(D/E)XK nuclease family protein [Calditrichota bacterium]
MKTHRPDLCSKIVEIEDKFYSDVYRLLLPQAKVAGPKNGVNKYFFRLPLKKEKDFPDGILELTYYDFAELTNNLFVFFLKILAGIDEPPRKIEEDFSAKFLGNFAHDALNRVWRKIIDEQGALASGYDFSLLNREKVESAIREVRNSEANYYKFPQNYVRVYFDEILREIFVQQFLWFFQQMDAMFKGKNIQVFPEKDYSTPEERKAKTLIGNDDGEVRIKGRGDLRVEDQTLSPVHFHIFDYKTGKSKNLAQLLFYELFYYLLEEKAAPENVHSYFFHVMEGELKSLKDLLGRKSKQERIDAIKNAIIEAIQVIQTEGFSLPQQKTRLGEMESITRGDLFLKEKAKAKNSTRIHAN